MVEAVDRQAFASRLHGHGVELLTQHSSFADEAYREWRDLPMRWRPFVVSASDDTFLLSQEWKLFVVLNLLSPFHRQQILRYEDDSRKSVSLGVDHDRHWFFIFAVLCCLQFQDWAERVTRATFDEERWWRPMTREYHGRRVNRVPSFVKMADHWLHAEKSVTDYYSAKPEKQDTMPLPHAPIISMKLGVKFPSLTDLSRHRPEWK